MQGTMQKTPKRHAPRLEYTSQSQLSFTGFETPFHNGLDTSNRWVVLSAQIPWDELVGLLNVDDRETIAQITENMYLQYFLGYSSYIKQPPFDASLFVDIRKRLGEELISEMNDKILEFSRDKTVKKKIKALPQMMGLT